QLMARIEQAVTSGLEHALQPAVARQQSALAILHRQLRHQQMPGHGTPPSLAFRHDVGKQVSFAKDVGTRTTLPEKSAGRGFSLRDGGRWRALLRSILGDQA